MLTPFLARIGGLLPPVVQIFYAHTHTQHTHTHLHNRACSLTLTARIHARPFPPRNRLEQRAAELALEGDSLGRGLKSAVAAREKALVEHDVLKLQVGGVGVCVCGAGRGC